MDLKRIKDNVLINDNDCWIWNKSLTNEGYGQLTENKKYWTTHRYAYTASFGEISNGLLIRHKCHNRSCCNPEHLETGNSADNYNDSKEVYNDAHKKRRKSWLINGIEYGTCKEAMKKTGITMHSLVKYTIDGIFDVETYREKCYIAGWIPKI